MGESKRDVRILAENVYINTTEMSRSYDGFALCCRATYLG